MSTFCAPINSRTSEQLNNLRKLFDGEKIIDIDGKQQFVGNKIKDTYRPTSEAFGRKMFDEIVWRATYKPAVDNFTGFTDADFRRIKNEIIRESKNLNNPRLGVLERLFGVKRGVMGKFAVTSWMNKNINIATNYERTQYSHYIGANIAMSKFLRTAIIAKGGQSKFRPGIKTAKQLESLERKLALELANPKNQASVDRVQEIRDEMFKLFETEGGEVINEFREYLETTPTKVGREKIGEDEVGKPIYRDKTRVLRTTEDGKLVPFSNNVELAGQIARDTLDKMGKVMVNGLGQHKKVVRLAFLNSLSSDALVGKVGERVRKYEERIDENIKAINEGIKGGDYYPHYLMESFMKIEKIMEQDRASLIGDYEKNLTSLENIVSNVRQNLGTPKSAKHRKNQPYDNYMKNPLGALRKYSLDAINFNRVNYIKQIYLQGIQRLPKNAETSEALRKYVDDIFTLAEKGYTERPAWVNKTVRLLTGYEFLSKIGFGVGTAARNTMSGLYYVQSVGNREFARYLMEWNRPENDAIRRKIESVEEEQGFKFEDMSSPLFTEGLLPTEGVRVRDVDIVVGRDGEARLSYKDGNVWKAVDTTMSAATGKGAIFQKVTENFLRKHMFRFSYKQKYNQLIKGEEKQYDLEGKEIKTQQSKNFKLDADKRARQYALDIVNKYAFEYSASQKAPVLGGTSKTAGAAGQVIGQFFHFPFSFLQMQSEILRKSKDATIAKQWDSPDLLIPLRFAGLYMFTTLMSGVFNVDFHTLMENDTVERVKDLYDVANGEEDIKGRGYIGPAVGDLFFLATLHDFIELPDNTIKDLIVGYNDAYELTDDEKRSRLLSTLNVEYSKLVTRNYKALQNGTIWNVMMHEFGLYPKGWTRELRQKEPLKRLFPDAGKKKKRKGKQVNIEERNQKELDKLYRAMGV
tara:strand:- start:3405 stop:6161 length:2757 start_codon:yes stop_codon:yes gene_type:complete